MVEVGIVQNNQGDQEHVMERNLLCSSQLVLWVSSRTLDGVGFLAMGCFLALNAVSMPQKRRLKGTKQSLGIGVYIEIGLLSLNESRMILFVTNEISLMTLWC